MQSRKSEKKDPIRELPLREPGETLRERIVDEAMGAWFMWAFLAAVIGGVALKEWVHLLAQTEPQPYIFTVAAVVLATISFWQWQRSKNRIVRYRKGLKGERHVGQFLQSQLIPMGYHIL